MNSPTPPPRSSATPRELAGRMLSVITLIILAVLAYFVVIAGGIAF